MIRHRSCKNLETHTKSEKSVRQNNTKISDSVIGGAHIKLEIVAEHGRSLEFKNLESTEQLFICTLLIAHAALDRMGTHMR